LQLGLDIDADPRIGPPGHRSTVHLPAKKKRANQAGLQLLSVNSRTSVDLDDPRPDSVEMRPK
jgi:hypothetical protein